MPIKEHFTPKRIKFLAPDAENYTKAADNSLLALDLTDKQGREYHDLDILEVDYPFEKEKVRMHGVIRYSFGRFEVFCPFRDQNFIMGLNFDHLIVGNYAKDPYLIEQQNSKNFEKRINGK